VIPKIHIIRIIWTVCFSIGAFNHARDIWNFGWLPYTFAPMPIDFYWTALLPLDLLATLLVWLKPKAGAWLGLAIMVSDVAINSWVVFGMGVGMMLSALAMQSAFLLFVLATFRGVAKARPYKLKHEARA
jgi:hypothetical protein